MVPEDQTAARAPGRTMRIALAISLALNLAVVGVVVGTLLQDRGRAPNPVVRDIGFGPFTAALSPEDRATLGRAFREAAPDLRAMRRDARAELGQLVQVLRSTPFDAEALRAAIAIQDARGKARLELGQRLLTDRLIAMTPAEREAFARRLERTMDRDHDTRRNEADRRD